MTARPTRRRTAAGLAVLAAHALVLYLGLVLKAAVPVAPGATIIASLRLIPFLADRDSPRDRERNPEAKPRSQRPAALPIDRATVTDVARSPAEPAAPAAPTAPAPVARRAGEGRIALDGSEEAPTVEAAAAPPTIVGRHAQVTPGGLVLTPERKVLLGTDNNPALSDLRSNTPKPTFEERIAMAMDPALCLKVERIADGSIRRSLVRGLLVAPPSQATHGHKSPAVRVCP